MSRGARGPVGRREFLTALAGAVATIGAGTSVAAATRHAGAAAHLAASPTEPSQPTLIGPSSDVVDPTSTTPDLLPSAAPPSAGTATDPTVSPGSPGPAPATPAGMRQVDQLPAGGPRLAITVDDGYDSAVLGAFIQFAIDSGTRMTLFPNGVYSSWATHKAALAPLVDSGQVQLGNHTWSHPKLTTIPDADVADQIRRNDTFLRSTFGVSAAPWFRPPYGLHDARTDAIAADIGYTSITLWNGVFDDSSSSLTASQIVANAEQCFTAGRVVLGHANHPPVTTVYHQLLDVIRTRGLQTVTLADVFGP